MIQCSDLDKRSLELIAFDEGFRGMLQGTLGSTRRRLLAAVAAA
jgi:hypothetical protein